MREMIEGERERERKIERNRKKERKIEREKKKERVHMCVVERGRERKGWKEEIDS